MVITLVMFVIIVLMFIMREIEVTSLGLVEYDDGLDLQDALRRRVAARKIPDQLLLLEHPPVVTIGRNAGEENLVVTEGELARRGIALHHTGRGGDVTFHGPGQIVGYPIVDLNPDRRDVHRYVRDLEEVLIRSLADYDVKSGRIPGLTGVWIGDLKIAAIGVRISKWVTSHGFSLNVSTDLTYFRLITPCGLQDRGVTTMELLLGRAPDMDAVKTTVARRMREVFSA